MVGGMSDDGQREDVDGPDHGSSSEAESGTHAEPADGEATTAPATPDAPLSRDTPPPQAAAPDALSSGAVSESGSGAGVEAGSGVQAGSLAAAEPPGSPSDVSTGEVKKKKKKKKKVTDGLGTSRGIETMFRTSYRTHMDLSALADTKANIMISVNGLILTIILAGVSPKIDANHFLLLPTSAILITTLISMIYAILSARPRVTSHVVTLEDIRDNRSNILFFGNFTKLSEEDFVTGMSEVLREQDTVYYHMIRDIYSLGGVLNRKFALLRISYTIFMYGLVVSVTMFLGVYLYVVLLSPLPLAVTPFGT